MRCARDNPDDPKQSCKHCVALGIPCTYDYQPKKRGVRVKAISYFHPTLFINPPASKFVGFVSLTPYIYNKRGISPQGTCVACKKRRQRQQMDNKRMVMHHLRPCLPIKICLVLYKQDCLRPTCGKILRRSWNHPYSRSPPSQQSRCHPRDIR